jgi:hypothetical protein
MLNHTSLYRFFRTASMCLSLGLSFLVFTSVARAQSQDNWTWTTQRKLAVPDQTANRKCITITKSGFYVGKLGAGDKAVAVEQYGADTGFVKTWTTVFTNIGGLASDSDGNVYVFDQGATKVIVFDSQGNKLRDWGTAGSGDGQFSAASGLMVSGIAVDADKNVYVADFGNSRVQKFDSTGTFKLKFGANGDLPGQFRAGPDAVAVAPEGTIITSDSPVGWYHLCIFSSDGQLLKRGPQGDGSTTGEGSTNGLTSWGRGGNQSFALSVDGVLMVGVQWNNRFSTGLPGYSTGFATSTLAGVCSLVFPSYVATRGSAFDPAGNFWACRDKNVECMERRYRRDTFPTVKKALPQAVITKVSQAAGSKVVDVDLMVSDADSATVTSSLVAFADGTRSWEKLIIPKSFVGSIAGKLGAGVATGGTVRVSWDASKDMPGKNFANLAFEALAKDDRPEIGIQFVTLPLDASNAQPLKISKWQVQEDDLWDLWLWLLAKGDPNVAISGNTVTLTAAGQAYIKDALLPLSGADAPTVAHNGSASTKQGRAFAYKLMNCRPVTAAEVTRANAGRFNLTAVDNNSVVSLAP